MRYSRSRNKFSNLLENPLFAEALLIGITIFSIFTKVIYLQYTIKLKEPPFSLLNYVSVYIFLSSITIVLFAVLWFPKRYKGILLFLNIVLSLVFFSDTLYGRYYGIPLTIPILYQIGFVNDISESIFSLLKIKDIVFFIDIPVFISLIFLTRTSTIRFQRKKSTKRNVIIALAIVLSIVAFKGLGKRVDRTRHAYQRKNIAQDFGTLYFHGFDVYDFAKQKITRNRPLREKEKELIREFFGNKGNNQSKYHGISSNKNIIVIQVEAMQEFAVDLTIEGEEVTPFLNRLKENSFYFENIYHQVAGGNTSDAEFMLNNSLYPAPTGSVNYLYPTNRFISLGEILGREGYVSRAFHGYEPSFWNREAIYRNYKYDKFYSWNDFELKEIRGWAISDESFFKQSLDISLENEKFFSFLITLSSHHPYGGFDDIDLNTGKLEGTQVGNYLKSMRYVDMAIESLFKKLKDLGELNNTMVIIYGDHNGLYEDQRALVEDLLDLDGSNVDWKKTQKVPLWIFSGQNKGENIKKVGGQIDIMPTIMDLLGLENSFSFGKSLLMEEPGYCVKRDGTVILEDYFFDNSVKTLYHLESNEIVDNSLILADIEEKQKELIISDIILGKNLFNHDKLLEILE
ncbi:MAG: LTA synthase family protein [Tissierellaceae bacterium]|nr:LTA synthase family protein [Tissierellaceae bacterium]